MIDNSNFKVNKKINIVIYIYIYITYSNGKIKNKVCLLEERRKLKPNPRRSYLLFIHSIIIEIVLSKLCLLTLILA